jgi:hypothetical protein
MTRIIAVAMNIPSRIGRLRSNTKDENRSRNEKKIIHPPNAIQFEGMDENMRVLMFGPRSRLWERSEKNNAITKTVEYRDCLVLDILTRIA